MEQYLLDSIGKKLDVNCGPGAIFSGKVVSVSNGIMSLETEDSEAVRISIVSIIAVVESNQHSNRPGFIA
ncbi:MM0924 family protein [Leptolyngbya sp. 7M]|uniref:MM0924 family protein n=1 Tax=Leptolyngbya sp. 7M TaxID=2812896 RepID=UPI001B8BC74E|nr:MM0924 family protein [Leptolyngbya sp. 7M]QYO65845.1 hypothetical protein JVX88_03350 [Leptolyngbya sp. 7M]